MTLDKKVSQIVTRLSRQFPSFGGGLESLDNPIATALKNYPPQFAAGVDIEQVVRSIINQLEWTPKRS